MIKGQESNHWTWGIFYYNKEDKRLLPPKKNPEMGWTINFANPRSVLLLVVIILLSTGLICWIMLKATAN